MTYPWPWVIKLNFQAVGEERLGKRSGLRCDKDMGEGLGHVGDREVQLTWVPKILAMLPKP